MRYINKSDDNKERFNAIINDSGCTEYGNFRSPHKNNVKSILKEEQHDLCCYCGVRINNANKYHHIEHFFPRNPAPQELSRDPSKDLEYENLFVSCGEKYEDQQIENYEDHCGHTKANKCLNIDILNENIEQAIKYNADGTIAYKNNDFYNENDINYAIHILNLNDNELKSKRKSVIDNFLRNILNTKEPEFLKMYYGERLNYPHSTNTTEFYQVLKYFCNAHGN